MGEVPRWGGYTVNLIHYEDAATLTAAVSCIVWVHSCLEAKINLTHAILELLIFVSCWPKKAISDDFRNTECYHQE